jgi:ubiquinone/menaquinone biosynthesis C-methylase UbiE
MKIITKNKSKKNPQESTEIISKNFDLFDNLQLVRHNKKNILMTQNSRKKPQTFFDFCSGIGSAHLAFKRLWTRLRWL